jgi:hypothetical protein
MIPTDGNMRSIAPPSAPVILSEAMGRIRA